MPNTRVFRIMLLSTALVFLIVCLSFAKTDHREYKDSKLGECGDCHNQSEAMNNHGVDFAREHRLLAQKGNNNCRDCHQQSFCQDCHKGGNVDSDLRMIPSSQGEYMPSTHSADYISIHAVKAGDDPQSCYRCHESSFCTNCHSKVNPGAFSVKNHSATGNTQRYFLTRASSAADIAAHSADARRNLQSCEACHPDALVCTQCHILSPGARTFKSLGGR